MIAKLKGVVDAVDTDSAIVDVGGVGYLVSASARTLRNLVVGEAAIVLVETIVRFKRLEPAEIDDYLQSGEWRGKAGGYAIQGRAALFVDFLSGSYSNVVGLPLFETVKLLKLARP